jgi:hypothetical protein
MGHPPIHFSDAPRFSCGRMGEIPRSARNDADFLVWVNLEINWLRVGDLERTHPFADVAKGWATRRSISPMRLVFLVDGQERFLALLCGL